MSDFDFHELINSFIFMNTLITFPDGKSRSMDIDSVSYNGDYVFYRSGKKFYLDKIRIKMTEFNFWAIQKKRNPDWDIYFIATDSNTNTENDDLIWYIPFEAAYKLKQDNSSAIRDWIIRRDQMEPIRRHTIKWSFFPSFSANHENNPAANKADNTPDGK